MLCFLLYDGAGHCIGPWKRKPGGGDHAGRHKRMGFRCHGMGSSFHHSPFEKEAVTDLKELLLGGLVGLALGIAQVRLQLHQRKQLRQAVACWATALLRCLLLALGTGTLLAALMMWLAVMDVDTITVRPLDGGTLLGGLLFGVMLGCSGAAPATSGALLGAGPLWEGLCAVGGCLAAALCLTWVEGLFEPLRGWLNTGTGTWFQVTLDKPCWFAGGFLGQGCIGAVFVVLALCLHRPAPSQPLPEPEAPPPVEETSAQPQDVQQDAVIVTLPGEEPVVVDTADPPAKEPEEDQPD